MSASDFERYEIEIDNPLYPIALKDMNEPPEKLYVIGNPSVLSAKSIAVTGTRRSSYCGGWHRSRCRLSKFECRHV